MEDDNYQSIFVRKNSAILTFYPDLTRKCNDKVLIVAAANLDRHTG